jgi:cytidylate kinase
MVRAGDPHGMAPLDAFSTPGAPGPGPPAELVGRHGAPAPGSAGGRSEAAEPIEIAPRFRNLCISREAGAGGGLIGRLVATRLDWKLYNHEILEAIAHRMEVTSEEVEALDELAPSAIQDWLLPLREEYYAPQEAYLDHLAKLIEAIGRAGESVLVGRGSGYMLPATRSSRCGSSPRRGRAPSTWPSAWASRSARRARPSATSTGGAPGSPAPCSGSTRPTPHLYDLVLDSHSLSMPVAVEILVRAIQAGRPQGVSPPPKEPARGGE